jgi:hypothetical protein
MAKKRKVAIPKAPSPLCANLRCKQMYYVPGPEDGKPECHSTIYWCVRTLYALGPDGNPAEDQSCRKGKRSCYESE